MMREQLRKTIDEIIQESLKSAATDEEFLKQCCAAGYGEADAEVAQGLERLRRRRTAALAQANGALPTPVAAADAVGNAVETARLAAGEATPNGQEPPPHVQPSAPAPTRFGDFELIREIARGGNGVVYHARQVSLNRVVALKMLQRSSGEDVERFKREAEAAGRLHHANIVPLHQVGTHQGLHYLVMNFIDGESLASRIASQRPSPTVAAIYVCKIALAVQHAHEHGILHRDLKPGNILIDRDDEPLVTDFGIAKQIDRTRITQDGVMIGTPSYMPPEQIEDQNVGPAADIYALGAVLYELLTGQPPFRSDDPLATIWQVMHTQPVPPRTRRAGIDEKLETICLKCLHKDPVGRYANAGALADDLGRFLRGEPILARPPGRLEKARYRMRRHPVVSASLALVLAFLIVASVGVAWAALYYLHLSEQLTQEITNKKIHHYASNLARAEAEILDNRDLDYAARLLADCDEDLRGWEYWHLDYRLGHHETAPLVIDGEAGDKDQDPGKGNWQSTISPDGKRIAVATITHGIRLIHLGEDADKVERVETLGSPQWIRLPYYSVAFNRDGTLLAAATQVVDLLLSVKHVVEVWDVKSRKLKWTLHGHTNTIRVVAFSPSGDLLVSSGYDREIRFWDVQTGKLITTLENAHQSWVGALAFSPDAKFLASGGADGLVRLWDLTTGHPAPLDAWQGERHRAPANWVAFDPTGTTLASVGMDGMVRLWDVQHRTALAKFQGHLGPALGVAFAPDGSRLASGGMDGTIKIWDAHTGVLMLTLRGHVDMVWSVEFSRDGNDLVSTGFDGTVRVWQATRGKTPDAGGLKRGVDQPFLKPRERSGFANDVAFRPPDGAEFATTTWDGAVAIRASTTDPPRLLLRHDGGDAHDGPVFRVSYSGDGKRLATASWEGTFRVWDADNGRLIADLDVGVSAHAVALSRDGKRLLTGAIDGKVMLWTEGASGTWSSEELSRPLSYLAYSVAWSPDERWIAAAGYTAGVFIWEAETKKLTARLGEPNILVHRLQPDAHQAAVYQVAFNHKGNILASVSWDNKVLLWSVPAKDGKWTNKPLWSARGGDQELPGRAGERRGLMNYMNTAAFSPKDDLLAVGGLDRRIRFWDLERKEYLGHAPLPGQTWGMAWHPVIREQLIVANWFSPAPLQVIAPPRRPR